MKLHELKSPDNMTFCGIACRLLAPRKIIGTAGRIRRTGENRFMLIMEGRNAAEEQDTYTFMIENPHDAEAITAHIEQHQQNLAEVVTVPPQGSSQDGSLFYLHIVFFGAAKRIGHWYVTLDSKIIEALAKKRLLKDSHLDEKALMQNFCMNNGSRNCFAFTIGKYDPQEYAPDSVSDESRHQKSAEEMENGLESDDADVDSEVRTVDTETQSPLTHEKSIVIYGADFSILVRVQGNKGDEYLRAVRIDSKNRHRPVMTLAIGELRFCEHEELINHQLREQLSAVRGYLDLWSRYANAEGDFLLQRARAVGAFDIKLITEGNQEVLLYPKGLSRESWAQLRQGDQLLFTTEIPVYLQTDMTWEAYQAYLHGGQSEDEETSASHMHERGKYFTIKEIRKNEECIALESNDWDNLSKAVVSLSIAGNQIQIERREKARNLIDEAQSENPGLGLIIEGQLPGLLEDTGPHKRIEPLSPLVKEKIFDHEPTQTQIDAISMALNTPDIAIIQGPPGTGKTTVITAIIERLNEIADHRTDVRGSVLVTSFQHDAVRNVTERLRVNSLPTIKFGQQGTEDQTADKALDEWRAQFADKLRMRNPGIRETEEQQELAKLRALYYAYPSTENAQHLMDFLKKSTYGALFGKELDEIANTLSGHAAISTNVLLPKIRRLRTSKIAFQDDGCDTAYDLLCDLQEKYSGIKSGPIVHIMETLSAAAECFDEPDDELLRDIRNVQHDLLQNFIPQPSYQHERPNEDILRICERVSEALRKPTDEKDAILYELLREVENESERVRSTIAAYNFVYAATTQQSEGKEIRKAKNIDSKERPSYDTVVIDEAARANPGDLLIPMAQARRRIILVGDHRQLPHIYDEEIFESMQMDGTSVDKNLVKESMFQYLMRKANDLTAQDHIPRTITLNAQYRMHPLLGEFVSRCFYDRYDEGFRSPRPESDFVQKLWHGPLKWVNFSAEMEDAEKSGTSWQRECEAEYIASALKQYLNSPEGKDLSYGVITFYSNQRKLIQKKLNMKLGDRASLVRVGSVDAFQGMEFDVIFLSVVRCSTKKVQIDWSQLEREAVSLEKDRADDPAWEEARQKIGLRYYGFLVSENRLCVALSRQKKLLIVVGDAGAFSEGDWGKLAEYCVPAMQQLVALCKKKGVLVDGKAESSQFAQ